MYLSLLEEKPETAVVLLLEASARVFDVDLEWEASLSETRVSFR